jgi:nucleoside-diphosphate-sugar epimerase
MSRVLVTGGTGFIGAALTKRLVREGHRVRVLDDNSRGAERRLEEAIGDVELTVADVRDATAVDKALKGVDAVHHLAYVNGTEDFYKFPDRVLEIAVKGMMNVLDGCIRHQVPELFLASTAEVYQDPPRIPTDEDVPLVVPDVHNPRFSYGGGKIVSELLAVSYGSKHFRRVCIYRPHNVYGPDMGSKHVIPQFIQRLSALAARQPEGRLKFPIQGNGSETRSFCYIDDFIDGVMVVQGKGAHLGIYHIGTMEEVAIRQVAELIAAGVSREIEVVPGELQPGSVARRCPNIGRIAQIGYQPRVPLRAGLQKTLDWYWRRAAT